MRLKRLELHGFKSFAKKSELVFDVPITAIVGPNGSGKSNVVEAMRFVLGEQSAKSMRSKTGNDLIFKGSQAVSKMSRASVTAVFDNHDRIFHVHTDSNQKLSLDFDEIALSREVFADGKNTYKINGNQVRLKDILEAIASVNIGSSGHHIISQGEADRLLNANPKDRKAMVEDALGLKVYQYRLNESQNKLQKTRENLREVEIMRRELAPQLRYLQNQVDKFNEAEQLRSDTIGMYRTFIVNEASFLAIKSKEVSDKQQQYSAEIANLTTKLQDLQKQLDAAPQDVSQAHKENVQQMLVANKQYQELERALGKIEGQIELVQEAIEAAKKPATTNNGQNSDAPKTVTVDRQKLHDVMQQLTAVVAKQSEQAFWPAVQETLKKIIAAVHALLQSTAPAAASKPEQTIDYQARLTKLQGKRDTISKQLQQQQAHIATLQAAIEEHRTKSEEQLKALRVHERAYYEVKTTLASYQSKQEILQNQQLGLDKRSESLTWHVDEAKALLDVVIDITNAESTLADEFNEQQHRDQLRAIERKKIKIEDLGGGSGSEIMQEFESVKERDDFLQSQISDLSQSVTKLEEVIANVSGQLHAKFSQGVADINKQFTNFFTSMFGGGRASISEVSLPKRVAEGEDPQFEPGIDIKVQLPRKQVGELEMLSGGERSLTSIALLFALSQVNPPPFLILDETDAALDEANSRRYGDMLEALAKVSQLIVVTHNRETMSRAGILYGVTVGADSVSQLLSIKFDEAVKVAK